MFKTVLRAYMNPLCLGILVLGTAAAIALFLYIRANEQDHLDYQLQLAFDEYYNAIHAEGDVLDKIMQALLGLYDASEEVDRHEFKRFSESTALRHNYLKAVFWLPRYQAAPFTYPVEFAEPSSYLVALGGIDMADEPAFQQKLDAAAREKRLLVLPDRNSEEIGSMQSIRLFIPVYREEGLIPRGFIMLLLDVDEFIDSALSHRTTAKHTLDIAITHGPNDRLLFYHPAVSHSQKDDVLRWKEQENVDRRTLHFLEQDWTLLIRPVPGHYPDTLSLMPWFALFATLTITFLIAGVVNTNLTRRAYAETQVAERTRALQKSEDRLARLYDIISSNLDFADKTRRLLAYGCDQLGLQHGVLAHIQQGQYTVLYACSSGSAFQEGQTFPLEETCCGQMLKNQALTAITHVGLSGWSQLPCYKQYRLESYIGTPIYTGGRLYGTLSFSGSEVHETPFTQAEQELVQLMAQWLSMELVHIQFEERLLEQRNTISHILESTAEAFVAVDRKQTILYANSLTQDMLSLETLDLVGQDLQTVAPQTRELFGSALQATLENNRSHQLDRYYQNNGKWLEVSIHPTSQGASISLRDITQQKANAEMLSHTLGIKNSILNSANFTIIATDENGLIMSFNKAAERTLGYAPSEVIGRHNPLLFHDSQEIAARARQLSEELQTPIQPGFDVFTAQARRGIPDEQEWTYICRDGSRLPVLLSITEMTDEKGKCLGFMGIGVDITERKRIERIRDEFVSTVSHELRTPLTSIRGSLGLLSGNLGEQLPDQAHSLIEIAGRNTERLLHLINDILDINKIESGKMAFNYEPLPLTGFLQQAMENNIAYAREFNVELKLAAEHADTELYADEHRLMQVMNNLLSNAVKFSHAGGTVEIEARLQQHFVRISVTDHGKGIPAGFRDKVFQRFSQIDASDSRNTGGTGLGLSIAQAIVEQHGGQLNYVSQPGIGTTFYFDLPVYRHQSITRIKDQIISLSPPQPHRLLICEDDPDIAGLLQLMLARHGYQSDLCASAAEAREALAHQDYDALLLDILLPDLNGLDLIRQLRGAEDTRSLPIIVISAIADEARSQLEGGAADIIDWLDKPLDQDRLLDSVRRALLHLPDKPRLLYVEDDPDLQNVIGHMLQEQVALFRATSLQEARDQLAGQNFDLILLDVSLPDGSGLELLEQLRDQHPPPATVIFSNRDLQADETSQVSAALRKSNTSQQTLLETLAACLRQRTRPERGTPTDKEPA